MDKFTIGYQIIQYQVLKGVVLANQGNLETSVSSRKDSDGYVTGVSSHSTHYQKLYLKDEAGQEFVADLRNWDMPALGGHELMLIWVQTPYMQGYALVHNKILNQTLRVNSTEHYFKQPAESAGCLIPVFGIIMALAVPSYLYSETKNETIAWGSFFVVATVAGLLLLNLFRRINTVKKNGLLLRQKIEQIFKENL